jgi:hypothetical protein
MSNGVELVYIVYNTGWAEGLGILLDTDGWDGVLVGTLLYCSRENYGFAFINPGYYVPNRPHPLLSSARGDSGKDYERIALIS